MFCHDILLRALYLLNIRNMKTLTKKYLAELTYQILGAAIDVHRELGPGLLEKVYETCMIQELGLRGLQVQSQQVVPINYKGLNLDAELKYDLLVEGCIVVELKAVKEFIPVFDAQSMSYARLLRVPKSILINFTCDNIFKNGQKTFVNDFFWDLPEE